MGDLTLSQFSGLTRAVGPLMGRFTGVLARAVTLGVAPMVSRRAGEEAQRSLERLMRGGGSGRGPQREMSLGEFTGRERFRRRQAGRRVALEVARRMGRGK